MKKSIKYAGLVTAALLAVAPVFTTNTDVYASTDDSVESEEPITTIHVNNAYAEDCEFRDGYGLPILQNAHWLDGRRILVNDNHNGLTLGAFATPKEHIERWGTIANANYHLNLQNFPELKVFPKKWIEKAIDHVVVRPDDYEFFIAGSGVYAIDGKGKHIRNSELTKYEFYFSRGNDPFIYVTLGGDGAVVYPDGKSEWHCQDGTQWYYEKNGNYVVYDKNGNKLSEGNANKDEKQKLAKPLSNKLSKLKVRIKGKHRVKVYTSTGKFRSKYVYGNHVYTVNKHKRIKGHGLCYKISGKNQWVPTKYLLKSI